MYVHHIYDYRIKQFYSFDDLKTLYDINSRDFLKYYTLIGNIKDEWKLKLRTETINNNIPVYLFIEQCQLKKTNKLLYNNTNRINEIK